jgi:hypothetical protein
MRTWSAPRQPLAQMGLDLPITRRVADCARHVNHGTQDLGQYIQEQPPLDLQGGAKNAARLC